LFSQPVLHLSLFINVPPTTLLYTLSLHDALPISTLEPLARASRSARNREHARSVHLLRRRRARQRTDRRLREAARALHARLAAADRKSTRLNSSHQIISYAVFCLKKKNKTSINNK